MLPPPYGNGTHAAAHPAARPEPVVASWAGVVRRRWPWGLGVFALVMAAALALVLTQRPIHRAEARLRLADPPPASGVSPSAGMLGLFGLGGNAFANDFQVLRSRTLREAVVAERSLHVALVAPAGWHRDSLFLALSAGPATGRATFEISWTPAGEVQVLQTAPARQPLGTFPASAPARFGDVTAVFRPRQPHFPERFRLVTVPPGDAVRQLEGRLRAERAARDANVLDVSFDDPDPALAQGVVASAVAHFTTLRAHLYGRESGQAVDSLRAVSADTRLELAAAEDRLEAFQRQSGLVAAEAQGEALVERYGAALLAAETARAELEAVASALQRVEAAANPGEAWTSLVAHPRFLENQTVGELLVQMTQLEQRRIQLAAVRSAENLEARTVAEQIASLDGSLRSLARSYRGGLEERVRLAEARVAEMERLMAAAPSLMMELARRQRDMRVLTEVVVLTEQRLRQEELRQALTFSNVQVIDPAALRSRPVWPRPKLMLAAALMAAFAFAVLAMGVVERADGSVRSARQLAPGVASPLLAAVPVDRSDGRAGALTLSAAEADVLLRRGRVDERSRSHLVVVSAGPPGDAESLARAIEAAAAGENGHAALVPTLTVLPPVASRAAAEVAARQQAPVLIVLRAGETEGRTVAGMHELLTSAGAPVAGSVMLCRTTREAHIAWT